MTQKPFIHYTACAFLLAALTVPISAFAAPPLSPLARLYNTDFKAAPDVRNSDRFPRARYEKASGSKVHSFVWGDMQLDVRPGETIECSVDVTNADKDSSKCFYTSSSATFSQLTPDPSAGYFINDHKYSGLPDAVKVGWKATFDTTSLGDASKLNEAFAHLDLSKTNIGVKGSKGGRLWAYVWDFNTSWREYNWDPSLQKATPGSGGKVGKVAEDKFLNTSFFARLPNGNPVEIKLDKVSGDAFSVAAYHTGGTELSESLPWAEPKFLNLSNTKYPLYGDSDAEELGDKCYEVSSATQNPFEKNLSRDNWLKKYVQQGPCDADNWGEANLEFKTLYKHILGGEPLQFFYSGDTISNKRGGQFVEGAFDNYARQCLEQFKGKQSSSSSNLSDVPLYLEHPQFSQSPRLNLSNVTVTPPLSSPSVAPDVCVFPTVTKATTPVALTISGLGAESGKGQLVCVNESNVKDKKVAFFSIQDGKGTPSLVLNNAARYNCYVERVEQFNVVFADAEQVGAMRMYEVTSDGVEIPLTINWNDSNLQKDVSVGSNPPIPQFTRDIVFKLPGNGKKSPISKKGVLSANSDAYVKDLKCADNEDVDARCWGDYLDPSQPDNKKAGIGNGDLVLTWTYYPTSTRFPFLLTVTDKPVDPKELTNGCSDGSIDPTTGKKDAKYKPTDTDGDGIPDVVEGRPGIKVEDHPADPEHPKEIPAPNTDGGKPTGDANPDYDDKDTDGDGIPDKIECHFDPSHTGYGYVNGCEDTDNDGIPDYRDDDSDNDGVPDSVECIWAETNNGSNFIAGCFVTDPGTAYIPDFKNPLVKGGSQPGDGDADGDGIPDSVENKGADPSKAADKNGGQVQPGYDKDGNVDTDGDGIPDYKDTDSDNDGIPDSVECPDYATAGKCRNSDKPGTKGVTKPDDIPDYKDTDSDNDGIPDDVECIYDASNNGLDFIEGCIVTTGDNIPDYRNPNSVKDPDDTDGDGIPDKVENKEADPAQAGKMGPDGIRRDKNGDVDTDGDGTPDYKDTDSDGDGIPDRVENKGADPSKAAAQNGGKKQPGYDDDGNVDTDNDGIPNYRDTDSDGDKIPDDVECPTYKDKTTHYAGPEVDGCPDTDGDGAPDYKDTDSDNDGIPDKVENHGADPNKKGQPGYDKYGNVDTDGDGKPDYRDTDSDNDGIPDKVENTEDAAHKKNSQGVVDSDGDGIPDYRDTNSDNPSPGMTGHDPDDPSDSEECHYDSSLKSTATEKYVNGCISTEKPNDVPDYRNQTTKKGDDTDGDGIPDRVEKGDDPSHPRETTPGKPDYDNKDSDGDGIPDKFECPNWSPLNVGKNYVDGCPDSDGDGKPDYRDTDSNNDGKSDKDQCQYDDHTEKCKVGTPTGFGKGGYRYVENSTGGFGIVSGGCGCASTPDDTLPGELLIVGLVGAVAISRRRKRTSVDE